MNKRTFFVGLAALVLVCSVMLTGYPVWAASTTLLPSSYVTTSGSDGGQPVTNLHVQDQSGTQDDWCARKSCQKASERLARCWVRVCH